MKQRILNFLKSDNNFYTSKILKQHWRQSKYSYATDPRPDNGIMLVLRGNACFVTEEETITATAGNVLFLPKGSRYEAVFPDEIDDYLVSFDAHGKGLVLSSPVKLIERAPFYCVERFSELVSENYSETHTILHSRGLFYLLLDAIANRTFIFGLFLTSSGRFIVSKTAISFIGEAVNLSIAGPLKTPCVQQA